MQSREEKRIYMRTWRAATIEKRKAYDRARRTADLEGFRARGRAWHAANPEARKASRLRCSYKLTREQYAEILSRGCAICGEGVCLGIDHDHACCPGGTTCGRCVRGALCRGCNCMLGYAKDSPERLARAIAYLGRWQGDGQTRSRGVR